MWEDLRQEFVAMDPYGTGFVSREEFTDVLTELCVHLSGFELDMLTNKFDIKKDGRYVSNAVCLRTSLILRKMEGMWLMLVLTNKFDIKKDGRYVASAVCL